MSQVLSDYKPNTTDVSSCPKCCLTIRPTQLLWVHVPNVVWPQTQHHWWEFVPYMLFDHCCEIVSCVLSDHKPYTTAVTSCPMCCLTTNPTPLLWVMPKVMFNHKHHQHHCCELVSGVFSDHKPKITAESSCPKCLLTTIATALLWVRVPNIVWPQAQHHWWEFVPYMLFDHCCEIVSYVFSDHKPKITAESSCHKCLLTTIATALLWVRAPIIVWPQAQHHCCEFVPYMLWPQAQHHCCEFVPYMLFDHKANTTAVSSCSKCCQTISPTPLVSSWSMCSLTTCPTPLLWVRFLYVVWPQDQNQCCKFVP
jgi:phage gp36-like protein